MATKFVVVNENDIYIRCEGVYDNYLEAVGSAYCGFLDSIRDWEEGSPTYKVVDRSDFFPLESESGYGWWAKLQTEDGELTIEERWYVLWKIEKKEK